MSFTRKAGAVANKASYDKFSHRMVELVGRLARNERPTKEALAGEFDVSTRTIERDIRRLEGFFPIERDETGGYRFQSGFDLGFSTGLTPEEMTVLALSNHLLSSAGEMFSRAIHSVIKKISNPNFNTPYYIKPPLYEPLKQDSPLIKTLEGAIEDYRCVEFVSARGTFELEPYRLVNWSGYWLLLALDRADGKVKNFFVGRAEKITQTHCRFTPREDMKRLLESIYSPWYEDGDRFEVVIRVASGIAHFFQLKKVLPSQRIIEVEPDGALVIEFVVTHEEDVDNLIKSWLPDIQVLEPAGLHERIAKELRVYLERAGA